MSKFNYIFHRFILKIKLYCSSYFRLFNVQLTSLTGTIRNQGKYKAQQSRNIIMINCKCLTSKKVPGVIMSLYMKYPGINIKDDITINQPIEIAHVGYAYLAYGWGSWPISDMINKNCKRTKIKMWSRYIYFSTIGNNQGIIIKNRLLQGM